MPAFPYSWLNLADSALGELSSGIDALVTSLNLKSGHGAKFPASDFCVKCENEDIYVTTRTNDALNGLARGYGGTSAAAHAANSIVFQTAGKSLFQRIYDQIIGHGHTKSEVTDLGLVVARLTADRTTTSATFGDVTDLAIPIGAGQTWCFDAVLTVGCNNTGGSQYTVTVPAGATLRLMVSGNTSSATAWTGISITTSGSNTVTICTANAQGRLAYLNGTVVNGGNAGNIQVRFRSVTAAQTSTCSANSYIRGIRA